MATKIVTKNSSTAGAAPTASDLVQGELAVNVADKRLYTEDNAGAIVELGTNPYNFTANHNGSAKLATTSTGIDVTGTATMDGLTVGTTSDAYSAAFIISSATGESELRMGDTDTDAGSIAYTNSDDTMTFRAAAGARMTLDSTGIDVTGNMIADGVGIGTSSPSSNLDLRTTTSTTLNIQGGDGNSKNITFKKNTGDTVEGKIKVYADIMSFETAGAEAMRIDSAGNVGIGTSSPSAKFVTSDAGGAGLEFIPQTSNNRTTMLSYDRAANAYQTIDFDSSDVHFNISGTERMRIDSSGNLLVGKTATGLATTGFSALASGNQSSFVSDGDRALILNRKTSDGSILEFRKDGTAVGSIGAGSDELIIGTTNTGLRFFDFGDAILPRTTANGVSNGATDLGEGSNRFKNLYLSGGVYLGGTGAANKLDDYETGSWTPVTKSGSTTVTTTVSYANYVKIGALVYVSAFVTRNDGASLSSNIQIAGLPFQVAAFSAQVNGSIWFDNTGTDEVATNYFVGGTSYFQGKKVGASSTYVTADQFQNGRPYYISGVYNVAI